MLRISSGDSINMDSQDTNYKSKEWIHLAQLAVTVNNVTKRRFLLKDRESTDEQLEYELLKKNVTRNLAVCREGLQLVRGRSEEICWWLAAFIRSPRLTLGQYALLPPSRNNVHYSPDNIWGVGEYILQWMFSHCLRLCACLALLSAFTRNKIGCGLDLYRYVAPKTATNVLCVQPTSHWKPWNAN
jgi:hypothetical protein